MYVANNVIIKQHYFVILLAIFIYLFWKFILALLISACMVWYYNVRGKRDIEDYLKINQETDDGQENNIVVEEEKNDNNQTSIMTYVYSLLPKWN